MRQHTVMVAERPQPDVAPTEPRAPSGPSPAPADRGPVDDRPCGRATREPVPLALVAIELAALALPKRYRSRYDREFLAELYEMDSREQIKFATCVLTQSWHLRAVLRDRPPLEDDGAER